MKYFGFKCGAFVAILSLNPVSNRTFAQSIVFVDQAAAGSNTGTSWSDAYIHLQDALAVVQSGNEVWVAYGIYRPDQGEGVVSGNRDTSFVLPSGVSLFGGFSGIESSREERNFLVYESILSGDLLGNDAGSLRLDNPLIADNSKHIVFAADLTDETRIDGFTISGGFAYGGNLRVGSAVFLSAGVTYSGLRTLHIVNTLIKQNVGRSGSIFSEGGHLEIVSSRIENNWAETGAGLLALQGTVIIDDALFTQNVALTAGAMSIKGAAVSVTNSVVSNNSADVIGAIHVNGNSKFSLWNSKIVGNKTLRPAVGPMFVDEADVLIVNSVFSGNSTVNDGGALTIAADSKVDIINSVFAFNSSQRLGGAIYSHSAQTRISNSIFWQNSAPEGINLFSDGSQLISINHSVIDGGVPLNVVDHGNNLNADPLFQDADGIDDVPGSVDDDFRLLLASIAIDAGDNDSLVRDTLDIDRDGNTLELVPSDLAGNTRVFDGASGLAIVDIGVFEFGAPPVGTFIDGIEPRVATLEASISVFPNPTSGYVRVRWEGIQADYVHLGLYDAIGRKVKTVYSGQVDNGDYRDILLDGISSGVYFLKGSWTGFPTRILILD